MYVPDQGVQSAKLKVIGRGLFVRFFQTFESSSEGSSCFFGSTTLFLKVQIEKPGLFESTGFLPDKNIKARGLGWAGS